MVGLGIGGYAVLIVSISISLDEIMFSAMLGLFMRLLSFRLSFSSFKVSQSPSEINLACSDHVEVSVRC